MADTNGAHPNRPTMRERLALLAGRSAGNAARALGRGGGTALPGLVASRIAPGLIEVMVAQAGRGVVTVTGTNGKTTTTHLLAAIARRAGWEPLTNRSGSNLERGLVTAYVDEANLAGSLGRGAADRIGLFEVDEAALPALFPRLLPRVALFLNLYRDQLDRYGEVDSVAEGWAQMLDAATHEVTLVLNADDPSVAALAGSGHPVVTYGIEDDRLALEGEEHASDARFCICGGRFAHDAIYIGHLGRWRCPDCGRARPAADVAATSVDLRDERSALTLRIGDAEVELGMPLTGLSGTYSALAAAATAHALGLPMAFTVEALVEAQPAFGRQERFDVDGRIVRVLLAKNPAGLNEVVRGLTAARRPLYLLAMLNDGIQDGQDVSWIYDADIERLAGRVENLVCSGDRADDLALRFSLAGIEAEVVDTSTERSLEVALARTPFGGHLDVVATYTAMLDVREAIARRAGVLQYWKRP